MNIHRLRVPSSMRLMLLASTMLTAVSAAPHPASAGDSSARTPMILSHLPKPASKGYAELRAIAGDATGQALEMTKSEMWSVPSGNIEALKKAAAARGVEIMFLDQNWNHTMVPMAGEARMTAGQKEMMHGSMSSKAAMGMSMAALPDAKRLEYALTKGMNDPASDPGSATLVLPVSETISVTARRTHVEKTADGYVWHGTVEGTDEPVSLMWWPAGRLTGQVTYKGHIYALKHMGGAMHGIVEMSPKAMPPEHAPMDAKTMRKMNLTTDPLVRQGDAGMMRGGRGGGSHLENKDLRNQQDAPFLHDPAQKLGRGIDTAPPRSDATGESKKEKRIEITLLVAYTKAAARRYTDIGKDLVQLAVAEANQSFRASGIGNVRLKIAHTYQTKYREKGSHFEHVFSFADKGDGKMEEVHRLRNKHKADVALLIVDDANGCGLAAGVAPPADRAFAVVHHGCAGLSYSLAHEIGHIIGARHDMALDDSKDPFPFGHGFVQGTEWRTMMSYEESCGKCPRLPIWSNPAIKVRGDAAGSEMANNARVILENAHRVASFR